jgi:hypothetical protein
VHGPLEYLVASGLHARHHAAAGQGLGMLTFPFSALSWLEINVHVQ